VSSEKSREDALPACRSCRGHGWKLIGSRGSLALSAVTDRSRASRKRRCLDCNGTGKE
jgi:hypothetical protein